jgi:transcriptional regulator GlxA family with amidase domain
MDLALAFVEDDHGADVALRVARQLVLFVRRPGGQSQFSVQLSAQPAQRPGLRDLQQWVADHPTEDLSVAALAQHAAMSPRHFARAFRDEIGMTPATYVESTRVEHARRLLETSDLGFAEVARASGFGSIETMRRAFARRLGVAPSDYRHRFQTSA